jgi:hypothetical protein
MPADGIPGCPFASNGDVGTPRLEDQLKSTTRSHARPKDLISPQGAEQAIRPKPATVTSEPGQIRA